MKQIAPYPFRFTPIHYQQLVKEFDWQMIADTVPSDPMPTDLININGINDLMDAKETELVFINSPDYLPQLQKTKSKFCLITKKLYEKIKNDALNIQFLLCDDPRAEWAKAAKLLYKDYPFVQPMQEKCNIAESAQIGEYSSIDKNSTIDEYTKIGSNCSIVNSYIGKKCLIGSNVSLHHCHIGDNNIILSGVTLGEEGFGIIPATKTEHTIPVPQVGSLITGENVLIGSNSTIDRATVGKTIIGNNTKIDSNVHIGHNVEIGENCLIVACVGIGGSAKLGNNVAVSGCSTVLNHVSIVDDVTVGAGTVVTKDVTKKQLMWGSPARPFAKQARINLLLEKMIEK